ncbi:zinc finger domain-containing protein [Streptosporangium sp. OZ121]|uniref:zinc finger domain-containing protein n=1 Tax=Streptosporangium sp. OZ121 TaxID=3444183 RepID=UPI003F79FCA3
MSDLADPAAAVEGSDCPTCKAPAGSACRTRGGKVTPKYHTPRFMALRSRTCPQPPGSGVRGHDCGS